MNFILNKKFLYNIFQVFQKIKIISNNENLENFNFMLMDKLARLGCEGKVHDEHINFEITPNIFFLNNLPNLILESVFVFNMNKYQFIKDISNLYLPQCITNYEYDEFVGNAENWINKDICKILFNVFNGKKSESCLLNSKSIYHTHYEFDLKQEDFKKFSFINFDTNKLINYGIEIKGENITSYPFLISCIKSEVYRIHMKFENSIINDYYVCEKTPNISFFNQLNLNLINTLPFIEKNHFYIKDIDVIKLINPLKKKSILTHNCINQHLKFKLINVVEKTTLNNINNTWSITSSLDNLFWLFYMINYYFEPNYTNIKNQNHNYIIDLNSGKQITLNLIKFGELHYVHANINFDFLLDNHNIKYFEINELLHTIKNTSLLCLIRQFIDCCYNKIDNFKFSTSLNNFTIYYNINTCQK